MIYQWGLASYFSTKLDAQVAGEHLERLRKKAPGQKLDGTQVLADATFAGSPLHPCFEWDDKKAAHSHRLDKAGQLIGSIYVIPNDQPDRTPVRAFVMLERANPYDKAKFTQVDLAKVEAQSRDRIIKSAIDELERWRTRYFAYPELKAFVVAIDGLLETRLPKQETTQVPDAKLFACPHCHGKTESHDGHPACRKPKKVMAA